MADKTKFSTGDLFVALGALARLELPRIVFVNGAFRKELSSFGVVRFVSVMYKSSFFPVGYFEDVDWEEMNDKYGGPGYLDKHLKKQVGCFACPIR